VCWIIIGFIIAISIGFMAGYVNGNWAKESEPKKAEQRFEVVNDFGWLGFEDGEWSDFKEIEIKDTQTGYIYKFKFADKKRENIKFKEVK
jgi:hypothetical protein